MPKSPSILEHLTWLIGRMDAKSKAVISPEVMQGIPPHMRVVKPCAGALFLQQEQLGIHGNVSSTQVLLGQNAQTHKLEVFGGGLESVEEMAWQQICQPFDGFAGPFYHVQAEALLSTGALRQLQYNTKGGETDQSAAVREVIEEGLVKGVSIVARFPELVEIPVRFAPSNANLKAALEPRFSELYADQPCAAQIVQQHLFLGTLPDSFVVEEDFEPNDEIKTAEWITMGDIVRLAERALDIGHQLGTAWDNQSLRTCALRNAVPLHGIRSYLGWLITQSEERPKGLEW